MVRPIKKAADTISWYSTARLFIIHLFSRKVNSKHMRLAYLSQLWESEAI